MKLWGFHVLMHVNMKQEQQQCSVKVLKKKKKKLHIIECQMMNSLNY